MTQRRCVWRCPTRVFGQYSWGTCRSIVYSTLQTCTGGQNCSEGDTWTHETLDAIIPRSVCLVTTWALQVFSGVRSAVDDRTHVVIQSLGPQGMLGGTVGALEVHLPHNQSRHPEE